MDKLEERVKREKFENLETILENLTIKLLSEGLTYERVIFNLPREFAGYYAKSVYTGALHNNRLHYHHFPVKFTDEDTISYTVKY